MALIGKATALQVWGLRLEWLFIISVLGKWKQEDVWGSLPSQCNLIGQLQINERLSWKEMDGLSDGDAQGCPLTCVCVFEREKACACVHTHTLYIYTYTCVTLVLLPSLNFLFLKREKNRWIDGFIEIFYFFWFFKDLLDFDLCAYTCVGVYTPFVYRCP